MSDPHASRERDPAYDSIVPSRPFIRWTLSVGCWLAFTLATLWLALRGPRLWASAPFGHPADVALAIVGIGQAFFLAIAGPIVLRSLGTAVAVAAGAAVAVIATGLLAGAATLAWVELALKLVLLFAGFATIWANGPRWGVSRPMIWVAALALLIGWRTLGWLASDYASRAGVGSHDLPLRLLTTTFLHD